MRSQAAASADEAVFELPQPKRANTAIKCDGDNSSDDSCQKGRAKPGRKPMDRREGESKRSQQMREAQRAHRERKKTYIAELEAKVAELSTAKSGPSVPVHTEVQVLKQWVVSLETENKSLREAKAEKSHLESLVAQLTAECSSLKSVVAAFTGNGIVPTTQFAFPSLPTDSSMAPFTSFAFDPILFPTSTSDLSVSPSWLMNEPALFDDFNFVTVPLKTSDEVSLNSVPSPSSLLTSSSSSIKSRGTPPLVDELVSAGNPGNFGGLSITDVCGPFDVQFAYDAIKEIPSLKDFDGNPGHLFDLFMAQANCFDKETIKSYMVQICTFKFKMLDCCNILDKTRVIEVMEKFKERNKLHLSHLYWDSTIYSTPDGSSFVCDDDEAGASAAQPGPKVNEINWPKTTEIAPELQPVHKAICSIPSLIGANDLIDELCLGFSKRCTTRDVNSDKFFKHVELQRRLQNLCVSAEDRAKFMLTLEIARSFNKQLLNEWLQAAAKSETA